MALPSRTTSESSGGGADAWDARDREGCLAGLHPDIEYAAAPGPEGGVVQGREALGRLYDTWRDTRSRDHPAGLRANGRRTVGAPASPS